MTKQSPENWLPVPGFEGLYEISDHGRVRSLARTVHRRNGRPLTVRQRILKPRQTGSSLGHLQVALYKPGGRKDCTVDRLVIHAFGDGLAPPGVPASSQPGVSTSPKTQVPLANRREVRRLPDDRTQVVGAAQTSHEILEGTRPHEHKQPGAAR
jgi:hypothetical protein